MAKKKNIRKMHTKYPNVYITAVIPAHNEAKTIINVIRNIRNYVDRIIVACDNCSDSTIWKAEYTGVDVAFDTSNNHSRKAGALNQALEHCVDWSIPNQYLLIMDADTEIIRPAIWFKKAVSLIYPNRPKISKEARKLTPYEKLKLKIFHHKKYKKLFSGRAYDCVGSIFQAPKHLPKHNFIEEGQRLEWIDYRNQVGRVRKTYVLTGTCSLISAEMMQKVHQLYHGTQFYNNRSITEDFWMTIDLKECHARLISPSCCLCYTATKPNIRSLIAQRRRWNWGALQLIDTYKVDSVTFPYFFQQFMLFFSVLAFFLYIIVSIYLYSIGKVELTVFWTIVFAGFDLDQLVRIWKYSNLFDKLYALSMAGCMVYAFVLDVAYLDALLSIVDGKHIYWNSSSQGGNDKH